MAKVGELLVDVLARTTGLQKGLKDGERSLGKFKSAVGRSISTLTQLAGIAGGFAGLGFGIKLAADAEQMRTAFGTMLQSAEKGAQMLERLKAFAAQTPLALTDLSGAARTLLQFGITGDAIIPTLRMLGDAAGGNAQNLKSMALAFGQISSAGKLQGQDLMQLINAGFNPLNEISKKTGESMAELRDRMSAGKIGIDEVREAFEAATGPGGIFFGMMEKQSKTLLGRFSTLRDNVAQFAQTLGEMIVPALKQILNVATMIVAFFNNMNATLLKTGFLAGVWLATFFGVLKVMPMIISALRQVVAMLTAAAAREAFMAGLRQNWIGIAAGIAAATATTVMFDASMASAQTSTEKMATNMEQVEAAMDAAAKHYQKTHGFKITRFNEKIEPENKSINPEGPVITVMSMQDSLKNAMDKKRNEILENGLKESRDQTISLKHLANKSKRKDIEINKAASF